MAEVDEIIEQPSESQKRITTLSNKVREEAEAKEAALAAQKAAEDKAAEATRIAEFSEGFVDIMATNPAAKDHKDDIKAKVLGGMSLEDATFAVLGKAGKLGQAPVQQNTAGGSASISLPSQEQKSVAEMTQEERRAALASAPDLQDILAPRRQ